MLIAFCHISTISIESLFNLYIHLTADIIFGWFLHFIYLMFENKERHECYTESCQEELSFLQTFIVYGILFLCVGFFHYSLCYLIGKRYECLINVVVSALVIFVCLKEYLQFVDMRVFYWVTKVCISTGIAMHIMKASSEDDAKILKVLKNHRFDQKLFAKYLEKNKLFASDELEWSKALRRNTLALFFPVFLLLSVVLFVVSNESVSVFHNPFYFYIKTIFPWSTNIVFIISCSYFFAVFGTKLMDLIFLLFVQHRNASTARTQFEVNLFLSQFMLAKLMYWYNMPFQQFIAVLLFGIFENNIAVILHFSFTISDVVKSVSEFTRQLLFLAVFFLVCIFHFVLAYCTTTFFETNLWIMLNASNTFCMLLCWVYMLIEVLRLKFEITSLTLKIGDWNIYLVFVFSLGLILNVMNVYFKLTGPFFPYFFYFRIVLICTSLFFTPIKPLNNEQQTLHNYSYVIGAGKYNV